MIEELLYTDKESNYFLLDYAPGHSEMVIRSIKTGGQNIDRFFKNVKYINLPVKFTGIHIFKTARPASMPAKNLYDNVHVLKIMDDSGLSGESNQFRDPRPGSRKVGGYESLPVIEGTN